MQAFTGKFQATRALPFPHEWVWNWKLRMGQLEPFGGRFKWLKKLLDEAGQLRRDNLDRRRLLIVSDYTHWLPYCGALSALAYAQGHQVRLVHSLYSGWGAGHDRSSRFPQWSAKVDDPQIELEGFWSSPLENLIAAEETPELIDLAEKQAITDTQHLMVSEELNLTQGAGDRAIWEARRRHNLNFVRRFVPLLQSGDFDSVIMPNGALMEFGAGYRLCRRYSVPCTTFEFTGFGELVLISDDTAIMDLQTDHLWKAAQIDGLTPERRARAEKIFSQRERDWAVPNSNITDARRLESGRTLTVELGLDPQKPVVLLCANVVGDSVMLGRGTAFPTMTEWVQATVDYFKARPGVQLVVRVHPAEIFMKPRLPVDRIVRNRLPGLPANIRLVEASDQTSTYQLIQIADVGLVFNSTVGIEIAALGRPVITAGRAHYSHKGFTNDPQNAEAYFSALEGHLMGARSGAGSTARDAALLYVDMFFHDMPVSFPWQVTTIDADLGNWPLRRLLSEESKIRYATTLRLLTGESDPRRLFATT